MKVGTRVKMLLERKSQEGPKVGDLGTVLEDQPCPYIRWDIARPGMHNGCSKVLTDYDHCYAVLVEFLEEVAEPQPLHSDKNIYGSEATLGEFYKVVEPVMEFINNHFDPYTRVIIDCTNAEILSSSACHNTMKFVKD